MWDQQDEHMGKEWWYLPWQWGCWSQLPHSYSIIIIPLTLFSDTQMLIFHSLSYSADPILSLSARSSDIELKLLFFLGFLFFNYPLKHTQPCSSLLVCLIHPKPLVCLLFRLKQQTGVCSWIRSIMGLLSTSENKKFRYLKKKKASSSIYRTCMDLRPQ